MARLRKWMIRSAHRVLQPAAKVYFSKPRPYRYRDLKVMVSPGVFHPHLTISTKLLLNWISPLRLEGKKVLELGCGTAIVALQAAKQGAIATASDINPEAVANAKANAASTGLPLRCLQSDLFSAMPGEIFDLIIINPPYYPKEASDDAEKAWFCGADFEYFRALFPTMKEHLAADGECLMILSIDCNLALIQDLAEKAGFTWKEAFRKRVAGEWNFIFRITI